MKTSDLSDPPPSANSINSANSPEKQECTVLLAQPGFAGALRAHSSDAFSLFFMQALKNAGLRRAHPDGLGHVKLVAQIVRELDFDPFKLQITLPEQFKRQSYWEKQRAKSEFTCWNSLLGLLSCRHLQGDDWMGVLKSLTNAVEGKEREAGMDLVKQALLRPELSVRAIGAFPKLFRSARGKETEETALMQVAQGHNKFALQDLENEQGTEGLAVALGAEIVRALQAVKIKETKSLALFTASMTDHYKRGQAAQNTVFEIFSATHGIDAMMQAKDAEGYSALRWAALNAPVNMPNSVVGYLLDLGFDPAAPDALGTTPLIGALLSRDKSALVLHEFASRGALSAHDMAELSKNPGAVKDPESRAYLASCQASIGIQEMMATKSFMGHP